VFEGVIKVRFNGPWWWFENQAACGVSTGRSVGKKKRKKDQNIFNIWNAFSLSVHAS
jgi:hypothetical protein